MLNPQIWLFISYLQLLINQYVFSEWNFAAGFFMLFLIDTWSGMFVAYRQRVFCFKVLRDKLFDKSVAYFSIIIAYSIATKITIGDSLTNIIEFADLIFYSIFISAELLSIIKNWYKYNQWPFLKKIIKHLDEFDNHGNEKI
jgi:hypothetical protein